MHNIVTSHDRNESQHEQGVIDAPAKVPHADTRILTVQPYHERRVLTVEDTHVDLMTHGP